MGVYRVDVAYDGSGFRGYAIQDGQRTVQGSLEAALRTLLGHDASTAVAGRTDAGVHATGQVVSFESPEAVDPDRLRRSLNGLLGPEISISSVTPAADEFNARFSARWRRYRYLLDRRLAPDPLTRHMAWHVGEAVDIARMERSARPLVGEHDFSSFCRAKPGASNVRRLDELTFDDDGDLLAVWFQANSFCHQMVRSLVGHLYDIGRGFAEESGVADVLAAKDRSKVASVAPPHGLTLVAVGYD